MPDRLITELEQRRESATASAAEVEYDWIDFLVIFSKRRRLIALWVVGALVLSTVIAFLLPVKYTASVRIMPPSQSNTAGLMGMLASSGNSGAASSLLAGALGVKNPSDVYVAMLKSRTLRDSLISRFDLKTLYHRKTYADTRKRLEANTDVNAGKEGVITIEFEDGDPKRAADIAEGYLDELFKVSEDIAAGEAGERRKFYERELQKQKNKLADAEVDLKRVQQSTGLIVPSDQTKVIIENVARLRAMVAAKEVQLGAMRAFATTQNPEYVQAQRELSELQAQLAKAEKDSGVRSEGDVFVPTGKVPEKALQFMRSFREFKYQETVYEVLAKQYELARLDEARDYAPVQVLDHAVPPDKPSKPNRLLIISLTTLAGGVLGVWVSLLQENKEAHAMSAYRRQKWDLLKSYWRGKRD